MKNKIPNVIRKQDSILFVEIANGLSHTTVIIIIYVEKYINIIPNPHYRIIPLK